MTGGGRLVILTGRHRPHELVLQALALILGAIYLVGVPAPTSVAALMPTWAVRLWAAGLLVSGLLSVLSLVVRRRAADELRIEQAAMLIGAAALVWVTYAVFVFAPTTRAFFSGGFCLAWALANWLRAEQCRRDARKVDP